MKNNKTVMPKQAAPVERNNPSATAAGAGAGAGGGVVGPSIWSVGYPPFAGSDAE